MVRPNCPSLPAPQEKSWPWSLSATLWDSPQATCTMCCPARAPICSEENRKPLWSQDLSHSDMQMWGLGKSVCKAIQMGALIPNLVLKHFLQEESTRFYWNHVAAELFWKPGLQITGERQVRAPRHNDSLHIASHIQGNLSGYLGTNRLPRFEVFSLSFDVGISQDPEVGRPCKTYLTFHSSHIQWRRVIHKANQSIRPLLYCLMRESVCVTTSLVLSLQQVWTYQPITTAVRHSLKSPIKRKYSNKALRRNKRQKKSLSPLEDHPQLTFHHYITLGNWSRFDKYSYIINNQILFITQSF